MGLGGPRAGCPVRAGLTAGRAARPARLGRGLREVKAHEKGRKGAWRTKDGPPSLRIKGLSEEGTASGREGHGEGQGPGAGRPVRWERTGSEGLWLETGQRGGRWATMGGNR